MKQNGSTILLTNQLQVTNQLIPPNNQPINKSNPFINRNEKIIRVFRGLILLHGICRTHQDLYVAKMKTVVVATHMI